MNLLKMFALKCSSTYIYRIFYNLQNYNELKEKFIF